MRQAFDGNFRICMRTMLQLHTSNFSIHIIIEIYFIYTYIAKIYREINLRDDVLISSFYFLIMI